MAINMVILHISLYFCFLFMGVVWQEHQASTSQDNSLIYYQSTGSSPLEVIKAIAFQTHIPIGVIFGQNQQALCMNKRYFNLQGITPDIALTEAIRNTGYSLEKEDGVLVLIAPDVSAWQRNLLDYRYGSFPSDPNTTMTALGVQLTGWMRLEAGHEKGYGGSTLYSKKSQRFTLGTISSASTTEIANRIVKLGPKGIWLFKSMSRVASGAGDEAILIYSYKDNEEDIKNLSCEP